MSVALCWGVVMDRQLTPFKRPKSGFIVLHNAIFDVIMKWLSGNEFKVLSLIIRMTYGWHKPSDRISASQIRKGTGISSHHTIQACIDTLVAAGYITVIRGRGRVPLYRLNSSFTLNDQPGQELPITSAETAEVPWQELPIQNDNETQITNGADAPMHEVQALSITTSSDVRTGKNAMPPETDSTAHDAFCLPSNDKTRRAIANAKISDESIRQTMLDFHYLYPHLTYRAAEWKAGAELLRDAYAGNRDLLRAGAEIAHKKGMHPSYPGGIVWAVDQAKLVYRQRREDIEFEPVDDVAGNMIFRRKQ